MAIIYDVETKRRIGEKVKGEHPFYLGFASMVAYMTETDNYYMITDRKEALSLLKKEKTISFNGLSFDSRIVVKSKSILQRGQRVFHDIVSQKGDLLWKEADLFIEIIKAKFDCFTVGSAIEQYGRKAVFNGSLKLDNICYKTIKKVKPGSGINAPELFQNGKIAELLTYNLQDVRILIKLLEFATYYGYIRDGEGTKLFLDIEFINFIKEELKLGETNES